MPDEETVKEIAGKSALSAGSPGLRLIEFAPGEGSAYIVGAVRVPPTDAFLIGGSENAVLIFFGTEHPNERATHWFEATPQTRPYLARTYLSEKMPNLSLAALNAAHHVIAHLLGREAIDAKYTPWALDWSPNWQEQLAPLRAIVLGTESTESDAHDA